MGQPPVRLSPEPFFLATCGESHVSLGYHAKFTKGCSIPPRHAGRATPYRSLSASGREKNRLGPAATPPGVGRPYWSTTTYTTPYTPQPISDRDGFFLFDFLRLLGTRKGNEEAFNDRDEVFGKPHLGRSEADRCGEDEGNVWSMGLWLL